MAETIKAWLETNGWHVFFLQFVRFVLVFFIEQVAVRVRPLIQREIDAGVCTWMNHLESAMTMKFRQTVVALCEISGNYSGCYSAQCPALEIDGCSQQHIGMQYGCLSMSFALTNHCFQAVSVNHAGQRRTFGCRDRDELFFIVLSKTRSVCAGLIMPIGVWMQKILALLARTVFLIRNPKLLFIASVISYRTYVVESDIFYFACAQTCLT